WVEGNDERPIFNKDECLNCDECDVKKYCPTNAFKNKKINLEYCFGCGVCHNVCKNRAFKINLGSIKTEINSNNVEIPIVCRESDRKRAKDLALELKDKILKNEFKL
ncbi:MAG: 4Fe-4S binding protein, partial [Methanobacteriaceae archaeon]|nr:4Fe-4S binding protein [Methanobacteriaceae archaeon]